MDIALFVARLLLALVFVAAGVAKLADREGSRQAMTDFGVPTPLATPLGVLLPLLELAVAAALLPAATAWWGAVGGLALLLLFVVGIGVNLARGREPDCHCFGQLHSSPAGPMTLVRNGALAAVAAFVVWQGMGGAGPSALGWMGGMSAAQLVGIAVALVALALLGGQWWFLGHLLRQNGRLLVRVEALEKNLGAGAAAPSANGGQQRAVGLPVGSQAPPFSLEGLHGETVTLDALRSAGNPILLLFTDPGCGPCTAMLPEIGRWQEEHSEKLSVSLISRGDREENRAKAQEHDLGNVLLQEDWEVSEAYDIRGTPSAVLLTPDGKIGSAAASGPDAIRSLVGQIVRPQPPLPVTKRVGDKAPEVKLTDLEGNTVELEDYRGEQTLVLFWNPGCGFCQQMLPDLKRWEADPPEGAPRPLVVSAGTEEANRQMGLSSPVVLDQQFATGRAFGASGTPSAVLVNAEGRIASEVAVGAQAVLELAGATQTRP
ncbi:MAG: redoxin domain-containing protein [Actinomycetota bacterium]|nr:redoxin domain-containing protein [Actinomycetota bacterium]